ncbi:hypothetical protein SCHPADRAFT_908591 [Schizopora paradoxa]|uniref:F-box domain-containing protein n=1 Tax=Schizopora paradoxa TaxID=27342 RepID=A0A0H2RUJ4_9AGAM|nr:hypothetical protein SCHPADRAFT_908591 [Schizopora paradoxa]
MLFLDDRTLQSDLQRLASNGEYGRDGQPDPIDPTMARIITAAYETDTIVAILTHLTSMATDIQKQYHRVIHPYTARLSKGFAPLPDELIKAIVRIAVRMEGHNGMRQAKWLSQVSRRFRKIALEDRNLWTTLYSNSQWKDLEMLVLRGGADVGLHVYVDVTSGLPGNSWRKFMRTFLQKTARRWRTLTIGRFAERPSNRSGMRSRDSDDEYGYGRKAPSDTEEVLKYIGVAKVEFPCLEELDIREDETQTTGVAITWTAPQLRSLICSNYLPSPPAMFSSVTALTIAHDLSRDGEAEQLSTLLAELPAVSNVELVIGNKRFVDFSTFKTSLPISTCPSVTSFRLQIHLVPGKQRDKYNLPGEDTWAQVPFIDRFLNSLRFPNLQHLSMSLQLQTRRENTVQWILDLSTKLLSAQFGDCLDCLSSLTYVVQILNQDQSRRIAPSLILTIPLDGIPLTSTLVLTTCTQIRFTGERCVASDGSTVPARWLQELRFIGCDNIEAGGLQAAVRSLKHSKNWDYVGRVSVEFCKLLQYNASSEVIGKDKFHYLA